MKKESLFQFAKSGNLDAVPQVQSNATFMDLLRKHADLSGQYTDSLSQYGPNFPKVQRLQTQVKDLDDRIEKEKQKIVDVLESDFRQAREHETMLTTALDDQKVAANHMAEKLVEYNILKRETEANKALYEALMTKLKETAISASLRSSNIRVVGPTMIH